MKNEAVSGTVTLAHGAGGKQTSELIDRIFKRHFANPLFTADDAAVIEMEKGRIAMSTDSFIVSPAFFAGGNIGKLAICGTVNDLACMGAVPKYLTCAFVIEEGFEIKKLEEIAEAMEKTALEAGVCIVAGDTKVTGKGQADGVFINTTISSTPLRFAPAARHPPAACVQPVLIPVMPSYLPSSLLVLCA